MSNFIATEADLSAVADAIRKKGNTTESLVFPNGFVSAVDAIQTGGGGSGGITLLYSNDSFSIEYTSTAEGMVHTFEGIEGLSSYPMLVCTIENTDTAEGKSKFLYSCSVDNNYRFDDVGYGMTTNIHWSRTYNQYGDILRGTQVFGLWAQVYSDGTVNIKGKCNTYNCKTLTGTYKVKIYGISLE